MAMRPLDSDTLGELGEKEFGALCARADLIANIASRDRAGWDYVIDFRADKGLRGLDVRPAPISARVQVKTQWNDQDGIKLRLSSAEQLVKHNGPSFVCVLAVDDDLQFTGMRMIHCRGTIVGRVLKRLREAEARAERPNGIWLTIKPSDFADATAADHRALRSALEAACSSDQMAYLTAKDRERKTIGFEEGARELKVKFSANEDEIVDAFLGLRPIKASMVSPTETRFGIALPWHDVPEGPATLSIRPQPDRCAVVFRTTDKTYRMRGRAYRPPAQVNAAAARPKVLIRTDLLRMAVVSKGRGQDITLTVTIGLDDDLPENAKRKPSEWRDAYAVLAGITRGGVEMQVGFTRKQVLSQRLEDAAARPGPEWRKLSRLTNAAALVFERACAPNAKASLEDLWAAGNDLTTLAAMIRDPKSVTGVTFTTQREIALPRPEAIPMMLGNSFKVGEHVIAYGARAAVTATGGEAETDVTWSSDTLVVLGLQRVTSERQLYTFLDGLPPEPYRVITGVYQAGSPRAGSIQAAAPGPEGP